MKSQFKVILGLGVLLGSSAALAHGVTNAKASELVLHRMERLVALCNLGDPKQPHNMPGMPGFNPAKCKNDPTKPKKGIDPEYETSLIGLTIEALAHQNEDEPSFKGVIYQYKAQDGTQRALEIILDEEGRALTSKEIPGGAAALAPIWPDKDATVLSEYALHFVTGSAAAKPELKPYNEKLKSFTILPGKNALGQLEAVVDFIAEGETLKLRVHMKPNGDVDSAELVP
ncbi:MAG: hypothetical protein K2X47_09110 [Bdellovibrionales bacterium]|nr:hypothetical protein [Bdellovibrionales bacterium]